MRRQCCLDPGILALMEMSFLLMMSVKHACPLTKAEDEGEFKL